MELTSRTAITQDSLKLQINDVTKSASLYPLLFVGGARLKPKMREATLRCEDMVLERVPLVIALHGALEALRVGGTASKTLANYYYALKAFYEWADENQQTPTLESVTAIYMKYAEHLYHRSNTLRNMSSNSAFTIGATLGSAICSALDLESSPLMRTRLRNSNKAPPWKRAQEAALDTEIPMFGNALLRLSNALSLEALAGELPLDVELAPNNKTQVACRWAREAQPRLPNGGVDTALLSDTRAALINLRIEADFLIFMSQTGLNLEQVRRLERTAFRFHKSISNPQHIEVSKTFKARRNGEVEFEIHTNYRNIFDRYLNFRDAIFGPNDGKKLFEFLKVNGRLKPHYYDLSSVRRLFDRAGIPYKTPREIRAYRENYLLDKTGCLVTTSEMMQHSVTVAETNYVRQSFDSILRDVAIFQKQQESLRKSPAPGACAGKAPRIAEGAPEDAPRPNCTSPSGCLFCENRRDIDSMDHLWSLLSYRHLKAIELSKHRGNDADSTPAYVTISRLSQIVDFISSSAPERMTNRNEAELRISEGWFHSAWASFIEFAEGSL